MTTPACRVCTKPVRRKVNVFCSQACRSADFARRHNPDGARQASLRNQARKRETIQRIKLERGCADCDYRAHPAALDFDHRPGEKCDVVCANCHRIRTVDRRQRPGGAA